MKLYLYFIGKPRDASANRLAADYVDRIARFTRIEMREIRPGRFDPWERHPQALKVCLDPAGRAMDSATLARWLQAAARDVVFVVGGHDGLPPGWRSRADLSLSLSSMTFPHELARVLLAEQIYRALATARGHPYPR
ncbi:MAG: 23S rRNA (pseudouridine(1915)-N(3))-methyltransferase RlmH [Bryobacteraceae bacterium]